MSSYIDVLEARITELEADNLVLATGKADLQAMLTAVEAERDRLKFALDVIAVGETTNPAAMARAILSDPSGE